MRILLWNILSFCLLAYATSDCRRDCLNCHRHLYSHQQDDFSLLICVMECEGKLLSSATWGLCSKATGGKAPLPLDLDSLEDDASQPLEMWDGSLRPSRGGLKRLGSLARAADLDKAGGEKGVSKTSGLFRQAEGGDGDGVQALLRDLPAQLDIPKGVSGFLSRPFGYEPVGEAGVQELQKRFGGFIGVRKSARKWHNQKRFSEFLKQYLGMSPRSVEYDGLADDPKEQNEI
ncbi:prepronociceptin [Podarcis raffonei]|uniref:prepronociceptin n=1 Tax=Podarcis raffonei TaxID=65483 RepID=UPI0023291097|nr:prepronociceptin [Podarcis raffonei]